MFQSDRRESSTRGWGEGKRKRKHKLWLWMLSNTHWGHLCWNIFPCANSAPSPTLLPPIPTFVWLVFHYSYISDKERCLSALPSSVVDKSSVIATGWLPKLQTSRSHMKCSKQKGRRAIDEEEESLVASPIILYDITDFPLHLIVQHYVVWLPTTLKKARKVCIGKTDTFFNMIH